MSKIRGVGILIRDRDVLLMFRRKDGKEYWTFPGGGVEDGETVEQAVVREIAEETTVEVKVDRSLYHQQYDDGSEQYFYLCSYVSGEPTVRPDSPEAERMKSGNYYEPQWVPIADLPHLLVYPLEIRDWLLVDVRTSFENCPREASVKIAELRHSL